MILLKVQIWRPDTHPGHIVEEEWEYDTETGRDTGREHRGVSVRYPDGTLIHRDTHGPDVAHQHYLTLVTEHMIKNHALKIILDSLPGPMRKPALDSDGDWVYDRDGRPKLIVKDKHRPRFNHLGRGNYEFIVRESTKRHIATWPQS